MMNSGGSGGGGNRKRGRSAPKSLGARGQRKKPKDMPKRPLSAYNLFFQEERKKTVERYQRGERQEDFLLTDGKDPSEALFQAVSRTVAARWKAMSDEDKKPYYDRANAEMDIYRQKMDEYNQKLINSSALAKKLAETQREQLEESKLLKQQLEAEKNHGQPSMEDSKPASACTSAMTEAPPHPRLGIDQLTTGGTIYPPLTSIAPSGRTSTGELPLSPSGHPTPQQIALQQVFGQSPQHGALLPANHSSSTTRMLDLARLMDQMLSNSANTAQTPSNGLSLGDGSQSNDLATLLQKLQPAHMQQLPQQQQDQQRMDTFTQQQQQEQQRQQQQLLQQQQSLGLQSYQDRSYDAGQLSTLWGSLQGQATTAQSSSLSLPSHQSNDAEVLLRLLLSNPQPQQQQQQQVNRNAIEELLVATQQRQQQEQLELLLQQCQQPQQMVQQPQSPPDSTTLLQLLQGRPDLLPRSQTQHQAQAPSSQMGDSTRAGSNDQTTILDLLRQLSRRSGH